MNAYVHEYYILLKDKSQRSSPDSLLTKLYQIYTLHHPLDTKDIHNEFNSIEALQKESPTGINTQSFAKH